MVAWKKMATTRPLIVRIGTVVMSHVTNNPAERSGQIRFTNVTSYNLIWTVYQTLKLAYL